MKNFLVRIKTYFLILLFATFGFASTIQAQTIFEGTTEEGQIIGECLNPEGKPQCDDVECNNPEFQNDPRCKTDSQAGAEFTGDSIETTGIPTGDSITDLVIKFINFVLPYLALGAFLAFVVAAFYYVFNFGNDELTQKARKIMIWAVVGLLIVIGSFAIVQFLTVGLLGRL